MTITFDLETKDYDELTEDELDAVETGMKSYTAPKDRKNAVLWQIYQYYADITKMRQRHLLKISAIERGASKMSLEDELFLLERTNLGGLKEDLGELLVNEGKGLGPIWDWVTGIKGLKSGVYAAQLLAQIDDIEKCPTVSSLWRFCGKAVVDGKAEHMTAGVTSPYNNKLKSIVYMIGDSFIKAQTPYYVDIYYEEKLRQYNLHPDGVCRVCQIPVKTKDKLNSTGRPTRSTGKCPNNKSHIIDFTAGHLDLRARRKMEKEFLKDLWITWRETEGLPISDPYLERKNVI